ncbi:MAG: hypothetical protein J6U06_00900 [Spirochaetaceae bacterium]|nr:hypothetical protein [Spirochaetaceae bacterium]
MSEGKRLLLLIHTFLYAIILIAALNYCDVSVVPRVTRIGLSTANFWFRRLWHYNGSTDYSVFWRGFTHIFGYLSLAACAFWVGLFIREVIKSGRSDGVGVDKNLAATFFLYVIAAAVCLLFKLFAVNNSPISEVGKLKFSASFPGFHVMLIIIAMGSSIFQLWDILGEKKKLAAGLTILCAVIMAAGIFGSMASGVYWLTDIIGAILISSNLLLLYSFFFYV